ncbi:hypothetical protein LAV84_06765 [Rhizobium sp. VS19-DR104.2]|uniref:hypothetical protein n=1 Tax=unclassified Rhizobium TaxID=2613769 RepID=UPI001CC43A8A|nr:MULTISPECIES: hypothetical protein [unclassified Rhizobium]MBZ5760248.1 hypothetical protein [Rhizobium sp. VS19-DR96]MBZ5766908.1 hypothetical protein [Rhizobium sp. VS19-DR129.2]MBZ5773099.1 hypothetical protein [Rhizobium sp. VS19-DRK62.2]MBZ5784083.1 hypothetical protein [Rhizobium sp. VS19-DR121]MBZ5802443.1 hypothetical protein [Rhizobium sp. VS19-DR181]
MATAQQWHQVAALRRRYDEAARDWSLSISGEELFAVIVPGTPPVAIATLSADCGYEDREFLLHIYQDIGLLLRLLDEACEVIRRNRSTPQARQARQQAAPAKLKDYAAECAMKCNDMRFRAYLREKHDLETTDAERINTRVRSILAIGSRAELNTDPAAAARWQSLKGDFEIWSRT